jgi:Ca2+-binding RTX toxin-like protein
MKRASTLAALGTVLAATLPAMVASPIALAHDQKVDGVNAEIHNGTLDVNGSDRADRIALRLQAGDPNVVQVDIGDDGSADFSFARSEIAAINVDAGNGDDSVRIDDSNGPFTNTIPTTLAGGNGNDSLSGGLGAETFMGGNGNDTISGGKGADTAILGNGDDTFRWDPGDGSDVVEGQNGNDTLLFNGAPAAENVTVTANGHRLTFFRNIGTVTMDTDGVETVDFNADGGADNVTVNDLSATDVRHFNIDLARPAGDRSVDHMVVNGTDRDDNIAVRGSGSGVDVTGLAPTVSIAHAEPTDSLSVNTLGGNDHVLTSGIAGVLQVLVNGVAV